MIEVLVYKLEIDIFDEARYSIFFLKKEIIIKYRMLRFHKAKKLNCILYHRTEILSNENKFIVEI